MKQSLCVQRSIQRVAGGVESRGKRIPNNLKDIAVIRLNGLIQNLMVPRKQRRQRVRILLRQFSAAFDIGEEKCDGACRDSYSASPLNN